jgi:hypothetical protein
MDLLHLPVWQKMRTITLDEMSDIKLMNRIDTKYLIHESLLPELLESVKDEYRVQVVAGLPVCKYQTLYYDTPELKMYTLHHNRKLQRQKIRTRTYLDSNLSFLEVKHKNNKGRTKKKRIPIPPMVFDKVKTSPEAVAFLKEQAPNYPIGELLPQVYNKFDRITLVNNGKTERLTIDGNIAFVNMQTGIERAVPGFMIVELKQDGLFPSVFRDQLMSRKVFSKGFSKYCLGTVVTNPAAKNNTFKNKIRYIEKLTKKQIL